MSLPALCLAPHEVGDLASGEPLCAPAEMRVRVGLRLAASFYCARWIRLSNGKFDLVARRETPHAPLLRFAFGRTAPRQKVNLTTLIKGGFMRDLFFGADQKLIKNRGNWAGELILSPNGQSCWQAPDGEIAPFRWHNLQPNRELPNWWRTRATDAEIEAEVRAMLGDKNSDCAFSWAWLGWSHVQRNRVWARAERGDLDECERLLRAIAGVDVNWQSGMGRDLVFELGAMYLPFAAGETIHSHIFDGTNIQEFSESQYRLFALVFAHFGLNMNQPMERYSAARHYSHRHGYVWRLAIVPPSQHERLESLLDLRDWLRDKVSPAELSELMPQ